MLTHLLAPESGLLASVTQGFRRLDEIILSFFWRIDPSVGLRVSILDALMPESVPNFDLSLRCMYCSLLRDYGAKEKAEEGTVSALMSLILFSSSFSLD